MRMPRKSRSAVAATIVSFVVPLAAPWTLAALAAPVDDKAAPRPPQTQSPSPPGGNYAATPPALVAPATIQAFFATDLYAKDSGYISQINADIGDHVKKGDVLAVIDDPELQQQYARAQAAVQQAKAALEVTRRRLVGLQADRTLQQVTLKRWEQLFVGKAVTNQQLDEQRAKENVSSANLEVGKADVALAEANLLAANVDQQRLQALVDYTKIIAPFDGIITRRLVNPGDLVQAATAARPVAPLFTCQEIDVVRVFADVPEASAAAMRPGAPAEVRLYGSSGRALRATITRVAGALDPATRTMRIEIDLPNPDESLMPGMYAQVSLWPPAAVEAHAGSQ
jgi:RND family efflux transporter MFP subunit